MGKIHTDEDLFNGCLGGLEPEWTDYVGLEVAKVIEVLDSEHGPYCEALHPNDPREPTFYSVYARRVDGEVRCITDVPLDGDLQAVVEELRDRSKLPVTTDWTGTLTELLN